MDNIKNDLSERELSGGKAQDRVHWRLLIENEIIETSPTINVGKYAEEEEYEGFVGELLFLFTILLHAGNPRIVFVIAETDIFDHQLY